MPNSTIFQYLFTNKVTYVLAVKLPIEANFFSHASLEPHYIVVVSLMLNLATNLDILAQLRVNQRQVFG